MQNYLFQLATDKAKGKIAYVLKVFLFLLSLIYGLIVRVLIFSSRLSAKRLDCKVISVGNITLGGTGKTTLVEYIARYLKLEGHKVAVVTRGYGRGTKTKGHKDKGWENMGDEPYMLSKNLQDIPVIVDADRIRGANQAVREFGVDTVILDDGFQQWSINKDLEIVAIDATRPFGNRHMIPRGILREPLSSLKRADIFVLTKTNICPASQEVKDCLKKINSQAQNFESAHNPLGLYSINQPEQPFGIDALRGKTVSLFSGIGDPGSFENLIASLGIKVGLTFCFPDHHNYSKVDLNKIINSSKGKNIDTIITTEKDAVRLSDLRPTAYGLRTILVLRISLVIKDEQRFHSRLLKLYSF